MKGGRYAVFDACLPDRVIVIGAVNTKDVVGDRSKPMRFVVAHLSCWHWSRDHSAEQARLQTQFFANVNDFVDCFVGGVHGDEGHGSHDVGVISKKLGAEDIECAASRSSNFIISLHHGGESACGIHNAKIQTKFIHPFRQQFRHHCCGPISSVLHRKHPKPRMSVPHVRPPGRSHLL